jgi:hypothetical protein
MQRLSVINSTILLLFLAACSTAEVDVGEFTLDGGEADTPVPTGGTVSETGGAGGLGGVTTVSETGGAGGLGGVTTVSGTGGVGSLGGAAGSIGNGGATGTGGLPGMGGVAGNTAKGGAAGSTAKGGAAGGTTATRPPKEDYTEKVGSVSFDMVSIPGGTFTLGCESSSCDPDTSPVAYISVSDYHIMKAHVPNDVWSAVGLKEGTWYDCMAVACELGKKTGKAYRMMTEAEFEFAAKKHLDQLSQVDGSEEWAFNSWETKYSCKPGDVDPLGPDPGSHTQKTRRDKATGDKITGRLIRSIDGIGPKCRLVVSDTTDYPPGYPSPCWTSCCDIPPPPVNSYRDPQWVTGSDAQWTTGDLAIGKFDLRVWDDGTARLNGKDGQWFTSNNIAFVFVSSAGSLMKFPYIFLDANQGSVISETSFMNGGYVGRIEKITASNLAKPTLADLKSGADLAAAAGEDYKMVDMVNIPESAKKQDPRLLDTTTNCWFQNNQNAGGTNNYRQDIDGDELRFASIDKGQIVMLANGNWFTVNNTFLRITHSTGYVADYLYALTPDGYLLHNSFMGYERGDFRMFQKYDNAGGKFPSTCINDSCSKELQKGVTASMYSGKDNGKSTFVPAPCPAGGCK